MTPLSLVRWLSWTLVAIAIFILSGAAIGWLRTDWMSQGQTSTVTTIGKPDIGGPFTLVSHKRERVTEANFRSKPTAYFFGFTHCPEVCPTTLFEMTQRLEELGADADRLNVAFVTVDPERDTPDILRTYLESFDPRIIALTGTPDEVSAMAREFRIAIRKVPIEGGSYTMEHTASVVVLDAEGEFVTLIDYHEDPAAALAKLRRAIRS